jgi:hypothetical protein
MKKQLIAAAIASALTFGTGTLAQQVVQGPPMQAVVIVTNIDNANRIVDIQAKSVKRKLHLSQDIDMSQLQVGSRYLIRYNEAVATAIEPGAAGAGAGATREIQRTAPGAGTATAKIAGVIDALDAGAKKVTLRTSDGEKETFTMADGVSAGSLKAGDAATVTYQRALASQVKSTPQPVSDPAPPQ